MAPLRQMYTVAQIQHLVTLTPFPKLQKKADNFFFLCIQRNTFIHKETLNTHTVQQGLGNLAF